MLFRQMNYFIKVLECNSFTEAAEKCFISQSAISQQIQALESEVGVQLLIRENRKFTLTSAGNYFYTQSLMFTGKRRKCIHQFYQLSCEKVLNH